MHFKIKSKMFGLKHFSLEWNKGQKFDDENKNIHG